EIRYSNQQVHITAWADGKPSLNEVSDGEQITLRVLENGKQGLVTSQSLSINMLDSMAKEALATARATSSDANRRMGRGAATYPNQIPLDEIDSTRTLEENQELLSKIEKNVLKIDKRLKKVIKFQLIKSRSTTALTNSHIPTIVDTSTASSFVAEVLA